MNKTGSKETGRMEYWNIGTGKAEQRKADVGSNSKLSQNSIIPLFQASPLPVVSAANRFLF